MKEIQTKKAEYKVLLVHEETTGLLESALGEGWKLTQPPISSPHGILFILTK